MLYYVIWRVARAALQLLCNFIPLKAWRVRARNAVYAKYLGKKVVLLGEVDSHLPAAILAKINAYENEYFAAQNAKILATATPQTRERERVRAA